MVVWGPSSPDLRQGFRDVDAELLHHRGQDLILMFEMVQDDFNFLLVLDVDLEVVLGSCFCMPSYDVLPDHDERHQKDLN
jgi:hypothetical protein